MQTTLDNISIANKNNRALQVQLELLNVKTLPEAVDKVLAMCPAERDAWFLTATKISNMNPRDWEK